MVVACFGRSCGLKKLICILLVLLTSIEIATAQPFSMVEGEAPLTKNMGPQKAKGVIYFVRGYTSSPPAWDKWLQVPYFVKTLSEEGFDVISAKAAAATQKRLRSFESLEGGAAYIVRRVSDLRKQGYRKVVLAGHSWGAWTILSAQQGKGVGDALILSAPAVYGPKVFRSGRANPDYEMDLTKFGPLIRNVRIPTVLLLFNNDDYEHGDRGKIASAHFAEASVPNLLIDKPAAFSGHFAAWVPIFDYAFGECISDFLARPVSAQCAPRPLRNDDFRSIVNASQIKPDSATISSAEPLVGRRFLSYRLADDGVISELQYVASDERKVVLTETPRTEKVFFRNGLHCVSENRCSRIIIWSDKEYVLFTPKGELAAWWVELPNSSPRN